MLWAVNDGLGVIEDVATDEWDFFLEKPAADAVAGAGWKQHWSSSCVVDPCKLRVACCLVSQLSSSAIFSDAKWVDPPFFCGTAGVRS